jgi:FkbM family methyltransferase
MVRMVRPFKPLLAKTIWPEGAVRTILWGPSRGLQYRIFPGMGLSPIYGGWEEDAQALMRRHIGPGAVVYDLGANYGIHTLLFAKLVREAGHVYAFEPLPDIHSALKTNVALNNFRNVTCVKLAVSDRTGATSFLAGHHVGAGHLADVGDGQGTQLIVKTVTLDEFVLDQNHRPPDFIKIDIEGAEGRALSGAERLLKECAPILLIDLHSPKQDLAVGKVLLNCKYEAYRSEGGSKVKDLSKAWPNPEGLWGQVIAFPKN